MEFYTVSKQKRPVRLSEATRRFAYDSLHHVYGLDTAAHPAVPLDDVPGFDEMTPVEKYDLAIRSIAEQAPIRLCEGEKISGAATLGTAISHRVPATRGGEALFWSISHLTIDFETVLKRGINGIASDIAEAKKQPRDAREKEFLQSCENTVESLGIWHERYLKAMENRPEFAENARNLARVPFEPPRTFYEAVQSLWFVFAFVRLCGNWPGFGCIDRLLGDFLKRDLASGALTLDEAREILAHFFIKGCEWVKGGDYGSGDAQHYQNIVLAGTDENGREIANDVTYLVLDVIEELGISDFPTTIRLHGRTPERLLHRAAEVLRFGGGILAFYNEETILPALMRYGYPADEAWKFANDGCWEVQIPGRTYFTYIPFDSLQILQKILPDSSDKTFDELLDAYEGALGEEVKRLCAERNGAVASLAEHLWKPQPPCTVVSIFEHGCISSARSYLEGGPVYNVQSPHIGGLADTVNSLYAIKKLVFDEKRLTLSELNAILARNWEGAEDLRLHAKNDFAYYGNDNDECDAIAAHILHSFACSCAAQEKKGGYAFPPGASTFGRQLEWAPYRAATASGHRKGEVLAANASPTPGSDKEGATAIVKSYCKADLTEMTTGSALDIKLLPSSLEGEDGLDALEALLRGFVALGGFFVQPDVEDPAVLRRAQEHPEDFQTLSVRVSGWNARFVTLCPAWQDMIIEANEKQ